MYRRFSLLTLTLFCIPLISARSYNVTIDDQLGDPITGQSISYNPLSAWASGQTCSSCTAVPSPADGAYMGTWKDASYFPLDSPRLTAGQIIQASVPFIGTAVYVNCILTGSSDNPDGNTDMTFKIDNVVVGSFQQSPNSDTSYHFNVTVFAMSGLENTVHTITLESGHAGNKALVLLDSIIYTKEASDPTSSSIVSASSNTSTSSSSSASSSSSSSNTPVIVGAVVGGTVAVTAILALAFLCYRRQKRRSGGVRVLLDSSDVQSPMTSYSRYSVHPQQIHSRVSGAPTLAPGDSFSQVSRPSSDRTSDWTTVVSPGRPSFGERARNFARTRARAHSSLLQVQNATDADMHELDVYDEIKPPEYSPFFSGSLFTTGKS